MPRGKPAGARCVQLDARERCRIFGRPERPVVCTSLSPDPTMCGQSRTQALTWLARLEAATAPAPASVDGARRARAEPHTGC
jgi:hypothetical protein